jgi:hypothetical protein
MEEMPIGSDEQVVQVTVANAQDIGDNTVPSYSSRVSNLGLKG